MCSMEILIVDSTKISSQIFEFNPDPAENQVHFYQSPNDVLSAESNKAYDYICVSFNKWMVLNYPLDYAD